MTNGRTLLIEEAIAVLDSAEAAEILGKSKRQAQRYGEGPDALVRTRQDGRPVLFYQRN